MVAVDASYIGLLGRKQPHGTGGNIYTSAALLSAKSK